MRRSWFITGFLAAALFLRVMAQMPQDTHLNRPSMPLYRENVRPWKNA